MTAGIILAIMITPIITSLSREVIATVPVAAAGGGLRHGRHPLGDDPRRGAARTAAGGIVGAVMLGLGPGDGRDDRGGPGHRLERRRSPSHLFSPGDSMAAVIANQFGEASGDHRSALIGLGVVLFVITIIVNVMAARDRRPVRPPVKVAVT